MFIAEPNSTCTPPSVSTIQSTRNSRSKALVGRCSDWLAIDTEIGRLSRRWSELEMRMARDHGWFSLSTAQQRVLPQAADMFEIETQINDLYERRDRRLNSLSKLRAGDMRGIAGKLTVAARLLEDEDGPAYRLVADVVRELVAQSRGIFDQPDSSILPDQTP